MHQQPVVGLSDILAEESETARAVAHHRATITRTPNQLVLRG
jgi:hypothetical protein